MSGTAGGVGSPASLPTALAASAVAHVLVALVLATHWTPLRPPLVAIPISLVGRPGGGGGGGAGSPPPPVAEPAAPPVAPASPPPAASAKAKARPTPHRARSNEAPPRETASAPPAAATPSGVEGGTGSGGGGGGDGAGVGAAGEGGGDGSGGARVAYGTNPLPPYPLVARRLGIEGVVLLEVLVAPDGRAADVRVSRSSGFAALDQSALTTVRERWRFVPARRGGVPVESRVTVPIRFRLDGES